MSHKFFPGFPNFLLRMVALSVLTACTSPVGLGPTQLSSSDQVATVVAATLQAIPTNTPEPTAEPSCPEPIDGTHLLTREAVGYCLLYPEGYTEIDTDPTQVCLVPEGPAMACHTSVLLINVESAEGRTVEQATDVFIAGLGGFSGQPNNLIIAGEEAVMLEPVYGQATSRIVLIVHADRLYTLNFIGPWDEKDNPELEQSERFYEQVIGSFEFLLTPPWTLPASQQLSLPAHVPGIKFIAETTGMYKFKMISGSYSICPVGGTSPECGKWHSEIFAYVNRDIAWIVQADGSPEPANPDFRLGSWLYFDTAEDAEAASGTFYAVALQAGDFVWLLPPDERDTYDDNVGGMTISISIMAPLS